MESPYKVKHVYPHGPAIKSCDCWWGNIEYEEIDSGEQQCSSEFFFAKFFIIFTLYCECREVKLSQSAPRCAAEMKSTPVSLTSFVVFLSSVLLRVIN